MRILVVNQLLPVQPMDGGRMRRLQHILALGAEHDVWVLGRCPDKAAGEAFRRAHGELRIVEVPESDETSRSLVAPAVRELMSRVAFDCVHVAGLSQWPGERTLGHARTVLDVESLDATVFRRMRAAGEGAISNFEVAATDALTRAACLRADLLLACSAADAIELRAMVPDTRIEIVPNAVDVAFFDGLGLPPRRIPPVVTFTGLLAYWPNADACGYFVDEILPQLEALVGPVIFQIVGRVPPASVVSRADGQRVRLAADVPDIRPWLAASDVIVVPLRAGSGTRVKILEAFAAGRPVVSTRIGCEGLDVEPGRHLLVADEPDAFAAATARVLMDTVLAERLTHHAGQLVRERFNVRAVTETLRSHYRELSTSDRRPRQSRGVEA